VTTTRITHASPAGAYSYTANRNWENDANVKASKQDPAVCDDIAEQLINSLPGKDIQVCTALYCTELLRVASKVVIQGTGASPRIILGIHHADHVASLYPQKLALTSPTSGGHSVGIVRSWTQATEFVCFVCCGLSALGESDGRLSVFPKPPKHLTSYTPIRIITRPAPAAALPGVYFIFYIRPLLAIFKCNTELF
jgi:hypothetical protein